MKIRLYVSMAALLLVLVGAFAARPAPALAYADASSHSESCSRFKASGKTQRDYVFVSVYNEDTHVSLVFQAYPASGGHFSISASFPEQAQGSRMDYYVWGNEGTDPDDYDGGAYFQTHLKCGLHSSSDGAGDPAGNLFDGRINNTDESRDVAAPVAIYRDSTGTLDIYAIDPSTGNGTKALTLTQAVLNARGIPSGSNLILGETTVNGLHLILSRLTTGELQLNVTGAGITPYIVAWPADNVSALYHVSP